MQGHATHRSPRLPRADPAQPPARRRPPRGGRGLRRRDVLRPLLALERAPGRVRLRVVVAGRRARGHGALARLRQRARAALPPRDHRPGRRDARRDVPGALLGRARHRRGVQRAHHGRAVAGQGDAQRAPARVRRRHARAVRGRGRRPRRARDRRPRAAVDAARRAAEADRRRRQRGDGGLGRRVGGRPGDDQPAARDARARRGRVPRRRRRGQAGLPPGPPVLGAGRAGGARHRPRPVAHQPLPAADPVGPAHRRGVRRGRALRAARGRAQRGARLGRPRAARSPGCRSSPSSASRRSTSTTSARTSTRSSTPSGSACSRGCDEGQGHQRPLVEERGPLLPRRRDVPGLRRRRLRRPPGPDRAHRLPRRHRRLVPVADAVLPLAAQGRRLRHLRLLRRRPAARDPRRLRRARAHRARPRHPRDRRPGDEPHLRPAPVVPGRARRQGLALPRLLRLGRREAAGEARRPRLPRQGGLQLGVGRGGGPVLPAPLLLAPARPQHGQPGGPRRDRAGRRLLARAGAQRLPRRRRPVHARADGDARRRDGGPARADARPAPLPRPPQRRGGPARRGQPPARGPAHVLRRRGRRRAADAVLVHRQPGDVPRARARAVRAARAGAGRAAGDPARLPVGELRAQPRRADARQAVGLGARGGVRRLRSEEGASAVRPRAAPAPADDARRRPAAAADGLQPRVLAPRHAGAVLRRGARDGREPRDRGPHERARPDAVVGRAERRLLHHGGPEGAVPPGGRRASSGPSTSTPPRSGATRTRC